MTLEPAAALVRAIEDMQRGRVQHRVDARAHQLRDLRERIVLPHFVDQVHQHLLLLIGLTEKAPVERRPKPLTRLEHGADGADQDEVQPAGALSEDLHDGAVWIPEDREEQECDRQDEQGAERRAREQVLQSAPDEHLDVEQLLLPDRCRQRERNADHRQKRDRTEIATIDLVGDRAEAVSEGHEGKRDQRNHQSRNDQSDSATAVRTIKTAIIARRDDHRQHEAQHPEHIALAGAHSIANQIQRWMIDKELRRTRADVHAEVVQDPGRPEHEYEQRVEQPLHRLPQPAGMLARGKAAEHVVGQGIHTWRKRDEHEIRGDLPAREKPTKRRQRRRERADSQRHQA